MLRLKPLKVHGRTTVNRTQRTKSEGPMALKAERDDLPPLPRSEREITQRDVNGRPPRQPLGGDERSV